MIEAVKVAPERVEPLRELHRAEMACQIIHDSFLRRALSEPFLLQIDGATAGYGLVGNRYPPQQVDEFFVLPAFRAAARPLFEALLTASGATSIRAQTNDRLLLLMLYDFANRITSDTVLFADALTTSLAPPGAVFRRLSEEEKATLFAKDEAVGDYGVEYEGRVVAKGGVLFHYNPPYGDIFMEVEEAFRRRGFGSYLVQELKRACYGMGKLPAARCRVTNLASRATLEKAGMLPCGRQLQGKVRARDEV